MRKILTCKVDFLRRDGERRSSFWQIRSVRLCLSTRSLINIDGPLALMRGLRRKRGYVLYTSRVQPCDLARLIVTCILRDYSVPIRDRAPPRSLLFLSLSLPPIIGFTGIRDEAARPSYTVNWTITTGWTSENRVTSRVDWKSLFTSGSCSFN